MRADLGRILGDEHVLDPAAPYLDDASAASGVRGRADVVVRPGNAEEVARVVAWAYDRGVAVVPRGGGTGYAGGAVPLDGGVVLALERLRTVRSFDPLLWRMEAEAGVTTSTVARLARENGLLYPPDPGAAESSQIGGNAATNAGGPHAFKYGVTGAWITGLEAVVAPGELVRLGGAVRKDVAGYDLRSLLIGSEGTLGVITAVWLRLIPAPEAALPLAASFADAREGGEAIAAIMGSGVVPAAIEYLDAGTVGAAAATFPGPLDDERRFLLLVEADGSRAEAEHVLAELREVLGDAVVHAPAAPADVRVFWEWRSAVSHAVTAKRGGKLSEDVAVPVDRLADAIEETVEIGARHGLEACSWGHAGDGNLHSTFLLDPGDEEQRRRAHAAADELFAMAVRLGGTVSGEHGLGLLKNGQLSRQWAPAAVAMHRSVKEALDPKGLLNPGKKLP
ncbi:MAG TPA: FAD-linked oxidase C-terminal domain-containing protein [Solirubrobacteraceae bacterium]|nr:FAD-linked oxidase C-terminal domain-containing protein [Solirubrobacteraceae bacterium]